MSLAQELPPFPPSSDCSLCISLVGFVYLLKKIFEDNISGFFTEFCSLILGSLLQAPPRLRTEVVARGKEGGRTGDLAGVHLAEGTRLQQPRKGRGTSPGHKGKGWRAGEAGRAVQGCAVKDTIGVSCFLSGQVRN